MQVLNWKDNSDGSATIEVEITDEEKILLINHAINDILRTFIERQNEMEIDRLIEKQHSEESPNNA
jgi:hypothetical protein